MTKLNRIDCFNEIGGFVREIMWDGIDSDLCSMLDWISCSWDEPELRFVHMKMLNLELFTKIQNTGFADW
jgi:hypothetical protein